MSKSKNQSTCLVEVVSARMQEERKKHSALQRASISIYGGRKDDIAADIQKMTQSIGLGVMVMHGVLLKDIGVLLRYHVAKKFSNKQIVLR